MNITALRRHPLTAAALGGFLIFLIRSQLYRVGFDDRGILSASHPLHLISLVLAAAMALYLIRASRREFSGGASLARFLTGLVGCYLLLLHGLNLFRELNGPLSLLRFALAIGAAIAMAVCVFPVEKRNFITASCLGLVCIHYGMDMLCRYRIWSGNPQLPDYCLHVLCAVALSMGTYHALALYTDLAKPRQHRFFCLAALYLSLACLVGPERWEFYLSGAFWAVACLMLPGPSQEEDPEEDADVSA